MPRPYEDPQLTQLAQIAQIAHLLSGPEQTQQEIDQRDQAAKLTAAIHLLGLHQEQAHNAAALDELTKYHAGELAHGQAALDAAMKEREIAAKSNVTDAMVSHLLSDPSLPAEVKASTLEGLGFPQMKEALGQVKQAETQKKVAALLPAITAAHAKGPDVYKTVLDSAKADPDVWNALQPHLPAIETPTSSGGASSTSPEGYFPGLAGSVGQGVKYLPITTANLGALLYNKALVPPLNLVNSLVGAPPLYPTKMAPLNYGSLFTNLLKRESDRQ